MRDSWQKPVEMLLSHVAPVKEEANLGGWVRLVRSMAKKKTYWLLLNCGGQKVSRYLLPGQVDNRPEAEDTRYM